ncbi:hypothetical protein AX769_03820 [Frondihabitans sp. PAMC 28766]|uniref:sensor histidine kinase n=1 Tax=Frondihabitans sp. PAMC 28766 TaxID=1795630 RepID=UPI00078C13FA|nr:histidine kinase [Frondihabitans sp. PAMC 28766]AMM19427.1 hypothetical protein AX769_03820 [Frondihabitans sp. PAMC 28766]
MSTTFRVARARGIGHRGAQLTVTDIVRPIGMVSYVAIIAGSLATVHASSLVWMFFTPVALLSLGSILPLRHVPEGVRLAGFVVWAVLAAVLFSINGGTYAEGFVFLAAAGAGQLLSSSRDAGIVAATAAAMNAVGIIVIHGGEYIGWPWWLGLGAGAGIYVGIARRLSVEKRSDTAALATERKRAEEAETARAAVLERNAVALDINDTLSESLSSVSIQLDLVDALQSTDAANSRASNALRNARSLTRAGVVATRRAVDALKTQSLPAHTSIESIARAHRAVFDVIGEPAGLPVPTEQVLLRAVAESLSDAALFAPAAWVQISLDLTDPSWAEVAIVNGPSIEGHDARVTGLVDGPAVNTLGLQMVQERARLLGGSLEAGPTLDDAANPGWAVHVRLPR